MKKFLALLLAVMMIASMSITAFAADDDDSTGLMYGDNQSVNTSDSTVLVNFDGSVPTDTVYYVNVTWKALDFTYSFVQGVTWDPVNHVYQPKDGQIGSWKWFDGTDTKTGDASGVTLDDAITVVNHSNASVYIVAGFGATNPSAAMTSNGVTATIVEGITSREIVTAEGTIATEAPEITYDLTVGGTPTTDSGFELGTITVTISN